MEGTVVQDAPDHVVIQCEDCQQHVGHGITGNEGMSVSVAIRPEKITLVREQPASPYNHAEVTVQDLAYFGSFTVYHLRLPSGKPLKVSMANTRRHCDDEVKVGDTVWAQWDSTAQVVLTQ